MQQSRLMAWFDMKSLCHSHDQRAEQVDRDDVPFLGLTDQRLDDFAFAPANIVIDAGTTVTWTNYDGDAHTVTSDEDDELDSELLGETETFRHTFDTPGEYFYHCEPHSNMHGLVTVRPRP